VRSVTTQLTSHRSTDGQVAEGWRNAHAHSAYKREVLGSNPSAPTFFEYPSNFRWLLADSNSDSPITWTICRPTSLLRNSTCRSRAAAYRHIRSASVVTRDHRVSPASPPMPRRSAARPPTAVHVGSVRLGTSRRPDPARRGRPRRRREEPNQEPMTAGTRPHPATCSHDRCSQMARRVREAGLTSIEQAFGAAQPAPGTAPLRPHLARDVGHQRQLGRLVGRADEVPGRDGCEPALRAQRQPLQ
jgi:hypothetical protein